VIRLFLIALVLLPIIEIVVIYEVAQAIGVALTLVLLFGISIAGAAWSRRLSARDWAAVQAAVAEGRPPGREVVDGVLRLVGGILLRIPGFVTDAIGLVLILPVTRPLFRGFVLRYATRRGVVARVGGAWPGRRSAGRSGADVIEGEVVGERYVEGDDGSQNRTGPRSLGG
jgi:UPF0716 protein FxsA